MRALKLRSGMLAWRGAPRLALLADLLAQRTAFHHQLKANVLFQRPFTDVLKHVVDTNLVPPGQKGTINVADVSNYVSARIGWEWGNRIPGDFHPTTLKGQTAGDRFTTEVRIFLQKAIELAGSVRKTSWHYNLQEARGSTAKSKAKNPRIKASRFAQYQHLDRIREAFRERPELEAVFGSDYIVEPDIVVFSHPFNIDELGGRPAAPVATFSPLITGAAVGADTPLLHASVSCKLTIRSDRAQNARLEALNLIRTRKGRVPNIAFVTAEPLPSRIASLALGTGDVDCIYHAGLYELVSAVDATIQFAADRLPTDLGDSASSQGLLVEPDREEDADVGGAEAPPTKIGLESQRARLASMISQGRLRDISDLALDLLI